MKKIPVRLVEFFPSKGKCLKAIVRMYDQDGVEHETEMCSHGPMTISESRLVSIQEISEEEYKELRIHMGLAACSFV